MTIQWKNGHNVTMIFKMIKISSILCFVMMFTTIAMAQNNKMVVAPVSVITINASHLQKQISAIGTIIAPQMAAVSTEAPGVIVKIFFKNGQEVAKNQILLKLDSREQLANYKTSKASYNIALMKYQRAKSLLQSKIIARQDVDDLENLLEQAKAKYEQSQVELEHRTVIAPFNGTLTEKQVSIGDYLTIGQTVVHIINTNPLKVNYKLDEQQLPLLQLGQIVTLQSDAKPNEIFKAKLTYIAPNVDQQNRTVQLQATIIHPDPILRPGMYVNLKQPLQKKTSVFWVPEQAIVPSFNSKVIYIVIHGKAQAIQVTTIDSKPGYVAITGRIPNNALCVIAGQQQLKPGMRVRIVRYKKNN